MVQGPSTRNPVIAGKTAIRRFDTTVAMANVTLSATWAEVSIACVQSCMSVVCLSVYSNKKNVCSQRINGERQTYCYVEETLVGHDAKDPESAITFDLGYSLKVTKEKVAQTIARRL